MAANITPAGVINLNATDVLDLNSTSTSNSTTEDTLMAIFHYIPNEHAAAAAVLLFAAISAIILFITIKTRAWFMMTVVVTGAFEALGYAARVSTVQEPTIGSIVIMQCCLIISPILLAVVQYTCLGRLVKLSETGRGSALQRWTARAFTASDIFCLLLQIAGGSSLASTDVDTLVRAMQLLKAGIYLQLVFFTMFTCLAVYVHRSPKYGLRDNAHLRPVFICLYATIVLSYIRNIFRAAEFQQGADGALGTTEAYLYMFDFTPIYIIFMLFTFYHFGFYMGRGRLPVLPDEETKSFLPVAGQQQQGQEQQEQQLAAIAVHAHASPSGQPRHQLAHGAAQQPLQQQYQQQQYYQENQQQQQQQQQHHYPSMQPPQQYQQQQHLSLQPPQGYRPLQYQQEQYQ